MTNKKRPPAPHGVWIASGFMLAVEVAGFAACSSSKSATEGLWGQWPPHGGHAGDAGDADGGIHRKDGESDAGLHLSQYPRFWLDPEGRWKYFEETFGLRLSPEEKFIEDLCPRRPWSKNVPARACTKDGECGDGFCDRGQCSAIYTCDRGLGARCDQDGQCPYQLCIDGRCRSCASDEECKMRIELSTAVCISSTRVAPGRECTGLGGVYYEDRKALCINRRDSSYCNGAEKVQPHMKIPTGSEASEQFGVKLTPEQKVIADTCPRVPWSKHVPNRACSDNGDCGDGFCDRGKCSAIYTCFRALGSPCETDGQCPFMMCVHGHCSSCISDEECQQRLGHPDRKCTATERHAPGRECTGLDGRPGGMDWQAICAQRSDHPKCRDAGR